MADTVTAQPGIISGRVLAGNVFALGAGELVARLLAFVTSAYIARVLGADVYGAVGFALAVALYFQAVVEWGLDLLGAREIAEDPSRVATLGPHVTAARIVIALALGTPLAAVALLALPPTEGLLLALFALSLLGTAAGTRWIHLGLQRNPFIALARTLGEGVKLGVMLALVRGPDDFLYVPLAFLAGESASALVLGLPLPRLGFRPVLRFRADLVRPLLRRARPLLVTTLLSLVIYNADLILLRVLRGREEAGFYLAGYMLLAYLGVLGNVLQSSLVPPLTRLERDPERRREIFDGVVAAAFALGLPLAVGGMLLAPGLVRLAFGDGYGPSADVLAVLIWSVPLALARSTFQAGLVARGRQELVLRMAAWTAGLSVAANLVLIPLFGMMGAAAVTVAGDLGRLVLARHYSHRNGIRFTSFARLLPPVVAAALMAAVLLVVRAVPVWVAIPLGAVVYLAPLAIRARVRAARGAFPI